MFLSGCLFDPVKNRDINNLARQKRHNTSYNDAHALSENAGESCLHVRDSIFYIDRSPEIRSWNTYSDEVHQKSVSNQKNGSKRNPSHCSCSIVLINNIRHHKL